MTDFLEVLEQGRNGSAEHFNQRLIRALEIAYQDLNSIANICQGVDCKKCGNLARVALEDMQLVLEAK